MIISEDKLSKALLSVAKGIGPVKAKEIAAAVLKSADEFDLTSSLRLTHFLAQCLHETGGFKWMKEIWGPTPAQVRYEGRRDLGNVKPGDGKRFMGRGPFMLTGRANYEEYGHDLGIDLVGNPEQAADFYIGMRIAMLYWKKKNLNPLADHNDLTGITKKINGGLNGYEDRRRYFNSLWPLVNNA